MEYLAIKEKKIAKPKKPINIIFELSSEEKNPIGVKIVDKTRTSGIDRQEVLKRIQLPVVRSTILTKSVVSISPMTSK